MRVRILLLLGPAAVLGTSCGPGAPEGPLSAEAPSVLLVTLDTTRADRLGCYGYEAARTPTLDALASSGVRFEHAYSHVPLTLPSHTTILSGVHPVGTGLHVNFQGAVPSDVPLLTEMFAASGYRTGAFIAAWVLNSDFGLARGFQTYDDLEGDERHLGKQVERPADEITDAALAWLERAPDERFFLWVHYFDAHDPYEPPDEYAAAATPYDGELAFVDAQLARLVDWLDARGRRDETLIVVTGDHGEGLGEHGEATHGLFLYDSTMHVPLIVSWPGTLEPREVGAAVGLVDLHPTVVELCGGTSSGLVEGQSLAGVLRGAPFAAPPVYAESEYSLRSFGWAPLASLRSGGWKYIEAPRSELYATGDDPGELHDRSASASAPLLALREALRELRGSWTARQAEGVELAAGAGANLAALGYVEGVADISGVDLETLRDPKDVRHVFSGTMRAKALADRGRHAEVVELLSPLVEASPESDEVWSLLGMSLLQLSRFDEARQALEMSLRERPDLSARLVALGEALVGLGEFDKALEALLRAERAAPDDAQVHSRLGLVYARRKELPAAEAHYRRQCELDPDSPNAHTNLANLLFAQSRFDEGLRELDRALELDETCKPAWIGRLQALTATGRLEEARAALKRCLAALPEDQAFQRGLLGLARGSGDAELIELVERQIAKH